MRAIRIFSIATLLTATTAAAGLAGTTSEEQGQQDRDAARAIFRRAIELEKTAESNIPFDFDAAKEQLESAATELDKISDLSSLSIYVRLSAQYAASRDREASENIDGYRADGEVTPEELEHLYWGLRYAWQYKLDGIDLINKVEFKETGKKPTPNTQVGAPQCQSGDQQVAAMSSCFTVDTWRVFVPRGTRAALCKFVDGEGEGLINVRPLFENVIQETSCRLLDKTVVVNGVEKRVVRAKLKLSAQSDSDARGTATVRVVALYR